MHGSWYTHTAQAGFSKSFVNYTQAPVGQSFQKLLLLSSALIFVCINLQFRIVLIYRQSYISNDCSYLNSCSKIKKWKKHTPTHLSLLYLSFSFVINGDFDEESLVRQLSTEIMSKSISYWCIVHCSKSLKIAPLTLTAAYCMSHVKLFLPREIIKSEMRPNSGLHWRSG